MVNVQLRYGLRAVFQSLFHYGDKGLYWNLYMLTSVPEEVQSKSGIMK
jgi:hypothetical protein